MLQNPTLKHLRASPFRGQLQVLQHRRLHSTRLGPYGSESEAAEFGSARQWYSQFSNHTIPRKIAKTSYSRSSGAGGQKTNKTSSKATTTWQISSLEHYVPKILQPHLRTSRYYSASSDSILIQCDSSRSQPDNEDETHERLFEEIRQIYKKAVPGVTSPEQQEKVQNFKKAENAARLKMKKQHSDKKRARTGGSNRGDF